MIDEKKELIREYIAEDECNYLRDESLFECDACSCFEECYMKSCERCDREFAESVDYGGYRTEEEFWEQI